MNNGGRPPGYDVSDEADQGLRRRAETPSARENHQVRHQAGAASPCRPSLIQSEHETRKLMELTDPRYVLADHRYLATSPWAAWTRCRS